MKFGTLLGLQNLLHYTSTHLLFHSFPRAQANKFISLYKVYNINFIYCIIEYSSAYEIGLHFLQIFLVIVIASSPFHSDAFSHNLNSCWNYVEETPQINIY